MENATSALALVNADASLVPLAIPKRDLTAFTGLTISNQARVRKLLEAVEIIEAEPVRMHGYPKAAAYCAGMKGASEGRIRTMYREFVNGGRDWRAFVDGALENKPSVSMPKLFLDHLQKIADGNQRSQTMSLRMLRADWVNGTNIPGYGTWKQWWRLQHPGLSMPSRCPKFPRGWDIRNLRRYLDTSKARRTAEIIGLDAAKSHMPLVYTTRRNLWRMGYVQLDDVWHDFFVASKAEGKVGRPQELFAHDLYTARKVAWGFRVRTKDDNGKAQGLTMRMQRMLLASLFANVGYSPRGTILVSEHGTAAVPKDVAKLLYDFSGGLIEVSESGMQGAAAHAGQYGGIVRGNPRHKASLESGNKTTHALTGALPGQTGTNRDKRPEGLAQMLRYNSLILQAAQELPPETAALLKLDLLTETQAALILGQLYNILDGFTDHRLEGWEDNITAEAYLFNEWRGQEEIAAMNEADRALAMQMIAEERVKTRHRQLSRREVWDRDPVDLILMDGGIICQILGDEHAKERTITRHLFEFREAEIGPGLHRYESACIGPDGQRLLLKDGAKYLTTVNPFAPDQLFIRDAKGRYIGQCPRLHSVDRSDPEAMKRAFGRQAKLQKEIIEPLAVRQQQKAAARLKLHQHNASVIKKHGKAVGKRTAKAISALADIAATEADGHEDTADSFDPAIPSNHTTHEHGYQ